MPYRAVPPFDCWFVFTGIYRNGKWEMDIRMKKIQYFLKYIGYTNLKNTYFYLEVFLNFLQDIKRERNSRECVRK